MVFKNLEKIQNEPKDKVSLNGILRSHNHLSVRSVFIFFHISLGTKYQKEYL